MIISTIIEIANIRKNMKLYYSKGSCSLVPRIIIHEIGLRCEYEAVNLKTKETEQGKDFRAINPKGSVPVLEFKKGEVLTENVVILQFLADDSKSIQLLPTLGHFGRYKVLEWLNYVTTELHKGFGPLFNPAIPQETKDQVFIPLLKNRFTFVNQTLSEKKFLAGETFTLPDAYLFVILMWAGNMKIALAEWPALEAYFMQLKKRPAIILALKEEGILI